MNVLRGNGKKFVEDSALGKQFSQGRHRHSRRCSRVATPVSKKQPPQTPPEDDALNEEEYSAVGSDQYFKFITKELEEIFGLNQ